MYRCQPLGDISADGTTTLKVMERHPHTNQAFIPMGGAAAAGAGHGDALADPGSEYLVIVAKNGEDDRPDLASMRAFVASAGQGIVYDTGIWREHLFRRTRR